MTEVLSQDNTANGTVPIIQPWRQVPLDPDYSGGWVVTGDVDGDGQVEIVSARNVDHNDVHYTSAAVAHRLDGTVLWRWGDPDIGRRGFHHDVACQIHDWNGDGHNSVVLCGKEHLIELDGATGEERRRLPIPAHATDCLVFADLSGQGHASDILIKDRYTHIWALDHSGELLWTINNPGGFRTAHQPIPIDIDNDGRDEIMAGYAMLNPNGIVRWTLQDAERFEQGHLDCCRVLARGETPKQWQLVLSVCGAYGLLAATGEGEIIWERNDHHFESIDVGKIFPDRSEPQILVDLVDENEVWIVGNNGECLEQIKTEYSRFHALVDWDGDGYDEIVLPHSRGVFNHEGRRIVTLAMEPQSDIYGGQHQRKGQVGNLVLCGDMSGNRCPDITVTAPNAVYVFKTECGPEAAVHTLLGCGPNSTLY